MTALTSERNTPFRLGAPQVDPVAVTVTVKMCAASLVFRNAARNLTKGGTGAVGIGHAEVTADNTGAAVVAALEHR